MSIEELKEKLDAVKTSEGMSKAELDGANVKMNKIICEELAISNPNQVVALLAVYKESWYNKPGLAELEYNLKGANLSGADLSGANLSRANLSGAILIEAN